MIWTQECRVQGKGGRKGYPQSLGSQHHSSSKPNSPHFLLPRRGKQALGDSGEKPPLTQIMYLMILLVATVYSSISSAR